MTKSGATALSRRRSSGLLTEKSKSRKIKIGWKRSGVLQAAVHLIVAPHLYNIFTHDIPKIHETDDTNKGQPEACCRLGLKCKI